MDAFVTCLACRQIFQSISNIFYWKACDSDFMRNESCILFISMESSQHMNCLQIKVCFCNTIVVRNIPFYKQLGYSSSIEGIRNILQKRFVSEKYIFLQFFDRSFSDCLLELYICQNRFVWESHSHSKSHIYGQRGQIQGRLSNRQIYYQAL